MVVIKRDGEKVKFDKTKIINAIIKAMEDVSETHKDIANRIATEMNKLNKEEINVEEIQDLVEEKLMNSRLKKTARSYVRYRYDREKNRALSNDLNKRYKEFTSLIKGENEEANKENSNKDTRIIPTIRDYLAGFICKEMAQKIIIPKDIVQAHNDGIIHFHDMDYSPGMPMNNCCLINLEDMLQNGTVISGTQIETPKSFRTACTITTQIITQVASSQYGGNTINLAHLVPFIEISRKKLQNQVKEELSSLLKHDEISVDIIEKLAETRLKEEIKDGVQTIQYQLITMSTTNGQAPFTSMFMYLNDVPEGTPRNDLAMLIEEVLRQRIKGVKNEQGVYITTAFPKLLYVLDDNNVHEDGEYWYLTKLAAECSAKRLVPDYISAKKMRELKGDVYGCMGCRSFLTPDPINHKYWGRFNQGVVTISLPDIALSSEKNMDKFWKILDERLELCYRALMIRHNTLKGTKSDVAPILWQHGGFARLKPGEVIDELLYNNYSTISLGYAGLYECVKYMTGEPHTTGIGHDFGIKVMEYLNNKCDKWRENTNISFSLYGSPIESTTYKFAKCLQKRFGKVDGITDKDYVTNSYHVTPSQPISAFDKLDIESEFQTLSTGGAISYVETPNMTKNIDALLEVVKHIYEHIMYAEINTMTSYCHECGCTDIKMEDDLKLHCPQCGNDDFNKMNIALRVCGYISTNPFNDGRAQDIHDRVYHLGME